MNAPRDNAMTCNFATGSFPIRIDNHSSSCVSSVKSDFIGDLTPTNAVFMGFGNKVTHVHWKGTVRWSFEDDDGCTTHHDIPNTHFVPSHPKHWHFNQFMEDNKDLMSIQWIASEDQLADIMTKGLGRELFHKFVKLICGWAVPTKPDTED